MTALKAKTRRRRLVKISANLAEWLKPLARENGPVICEKSGVEWKKNGMRHSYASYHLSKHEDANSTALQLGHANTEMLFSHYRELVHPEDATEYWNLAPMASTNE